MSVTTRLFNYYLNSSSESAAGHEIQTENTRVSTEIGTNGFDTSYNENIQHDDGIEMEISQRSDDVEKHELNRNANVTEHNRTKIPDENASFGDDEIELSAAKKNNE